MNDMLRKWVDQNTTEFEYAVLWLATHDNEAWAHLSRVVCRDSRGKVSRDFMSPLHSAYYEVVHTARAAMSKPEDVVGRALFGTMLMSMAVNGDRVGRSEIVKVLELYDMLAAKDSYRQNKPLMREVLPYWINKQRTNIMVQSAVGQANWDAGTLLRDLTTELSHTNSQLEEDDHVTEAVFNMMNQTMPDMSGQCPTGLYRLDQALGGGYYPGGNNLVIAAPGVGKTVFACQVALHTAITGGMVALITTEQSADELTARWISNWCRYDFGAISHGYNWANFPREVQAKCIAMHRIIKDRIFIFDWKKKKKSVLAGGIEEEIAIAEGRAGRPCTMVIMDWLGGALTDDVKDDKDKKRLALQNTADRMSDIARDKNICTVVMAQANKAKGLNNMYVGAGDIPENHTLDQSMTTVTGITGLFNQAAKDAMRAGGSPDNYELFDESQFFFVSKARKSRGGHAQITRKFKYQRFEDRKKAQT